MLNAILLPETWLVQPQVVPLHVAKDPTRRFLPSQYAEQQSKRIRPISVAKNINKQRIAMVDMKPPDDVALRILSWIVTAGDHRYWSWSATKRNAKGKVRSSLQYELGADKAHVSRAMSRLIRDDVLTVAEKQDGREIVHVTHRGLVVFAEISWRHSLRDAMPELGEAVRAFGWQEVSVAIDREIVIQELEHAKKADIIFAAKSLYADSVGCA